MPDKIGNPLEQAATSGVLGQKRMLTTKQEAPAPKEKATAEGAEPERVKRTLMFTPARAKWLKVQAAQEEREMSEIVEEALDAYQKMHS